MRNYCLQLIVRKEYKLISSFSLKMEEKVFFNNGKGDQLSGILSNPTNSKEKPIFILCHGFATSKESYSIIKLEQLLNQNNISTFRFDFFGHGESEGKFEDITISEGVDDALQAIHYLKTQGYSKIGLFGSSFGGMVSIMTASKSKDLYLLVLKSPVSNFLERDLQVKTEKELKDWKSNGFTDYVNGKGQKFRLNYTFLEDYNNNDGYKAAPKIKIPTLIVHGDKDDIVPVEQSKKIVSLIKNCTLELIFGADHRYSQPDHFELMLRSILQFVLNQN